MTLYHLQPNFKMTYLPNLKSTIAFKQANSAGFTQNFLNRTNMSRKCFKNTTASVERTSVSGIEKIGDFSYGRDHWIAHNINSSDQLSSRSVTCLYKY